MGNKVHGTLWTPQDDAWVKDICDSATNDIVVKMYRNRGLDAKTSNGKVVEAQQRIEKPESTAECLNCNALFFHQSTLARHKEVLKCRGAAGRSSRRSTSHEKEI